MVDDRQDVAERLLTQLLIAQQIASRTSGVGPLLLSMIMASGVPGFLVAGEAARSSSRFSEGDFPTWASFGLIMCGVAHVAASQRNIGGQ